MIQNCQFWAKSVKLGKKCISVYVITKLNGNHFLLSSMKEFICKQKMKNYFHENFLLYDLIKLIKQGEIQKLLPKNR